MTVRHLLNQTSGFSFLSHQLVLADLDDRPDATERQVRALSTQKLSHPVGEKCQYNNLNYNILGLVIEAASGEGQATNWYDLGRSSFHPARYFGLAVSMVSASDVTRVS
jgi:CubicO group peptidase (beta-lactamase class C family)